MPEAGPRIAEEAFAFRGAGQDLNGVLVRPQASGSAPGIVVLHDVNGLTDHVKALARRLAGEGYTALAPDLFSRGDGPGWPPKREAISKMASYPDRRTVADVKGALTALRAQPGVAGERTALTGFSFGARYALLTAGEVPDVAAAVIYYPIVIYPEVNESRPRQPLQSVPPMKAACLVFYGDQDPMVPVTHTTFFESMLMGHGKHYEFYRYPGAGHGFFNDGLKTYNATAARDAWEKTKAFLKRYV